VLDFEILDSEALGAFITADARGPSPEARRIIVSLELLRRADNLEQLGTSAPNIDVVIVDEAHHMRSPGRASNALGEVLSSLAETLIFLTATPLNLGRADFFQLMHLLVPEEFPQYDTFEDCGIDPHVVASSSTVETGTPPMCVGDTSGASPRGSATATSRCACPIGCGPSEARASRRSMSTATLAARPGACRVRR